MVTAIHKHKLSFLREKLKEKNIKKYKKMKKTQKNAKVIKKTTEYISIKLLSF